MAELRIIVTGAAGRMGRMVVRAIHEAEGVRLAGALERQYSPWLGHDPGPLAGCPPTGLRIRRDAASVGTASLWRFRAKAPRWRTLVGLIASAPSRDWRASRSEPRPEQTDPVHNRTSPFRPKVEPQRIVGGIKALFKWLAIKLGSIDRVVY